MPRYRAYVLDEQGQFVAVVKRSEPLFLPKLCSLPYAVQRLGHANPALRPLRALAHAPLGPRPWLHRLLKWAPMSGP